MLVFTRKRQQRIYIGNDIVVTIVDIRGESVRIGVQAPNDVEVLRDDAKRRTKS